MSDPNVFRDILNLGPAGILLAGLALFALGRVLPESVHLRILAIKDAQIKGLETEKSDLNQEVRTLTQQQVASVTELVTIQREALAEQRKTIEVLQAIAGTVAKDGV